MAVTHEVGASAPLRVDGRAGFWNQVVIGADTAYDKRIGGLTITGEKPVLSIVDRNSPLQLGQRWDIESQGDILAVRSVYGSKDSVPLSVTRKGDVVFSGKVAVDGVLRVKNLDLEGVKAQANNEQVFSLKIGDNLAASSMRLGSNTDNAWVQVDRRGTLALNPVNDKDKGVVMFGRERSAHALDVKGDMWVDTAVRIGKGENRTGTTTLTTQTLNFAKGGGWSGAREGWIVSQKGIQANGAVFGKSLSIGTEVTLPDARLQVHNGHFAVTSKVGENLQGLATFVLPRSSHIKAYDYTRKTPQNLRVEGSQILLNPDQKSPRVGIGVENPTHALETRGNIYINGHVKAKQDLKMEGNMHVDKIITPKVFVHSPDENPHSGRGVILGDPEPNESKIQTTMRMGWSKGYTWVQSTSPHGQVPLTLNPIGGATCIGCKAPSEIATLQVGGHTYVAGDLYVATINKKKKKEGSELKEDDSSEGEGEDFSLDEAATVLEKELGATELNVMSAWSSSAKIIQNNHAEVLERNAKIQSNEAAIQALERQCLELKKQEIR